MGEKYNPEEPETKAFVRHELSEMYTQTERSRAFPNRLGLVATEDLEDTLAETDSPTLYTHLLPEGLTLMTSACTAHTHSLPALAPPLPGVSEFCAFADSRAGGGHLPGGHRHWKRLTLSTHCPLFTQGLL